MSWFVKVINHSNPFRNFAYSFKIPIPRLKSWVITGQSKCIPHWYPPWSHIYRRVWWQLPGGVKWGVSTWFLLYYFFRTHAYITTPIVIPRTVIVTRLPITIPTTAASDIVIPDKSTKQAFNYATISVHVRMHKYDGYKEMFSLSDIYLS
jgi:hypothetical protein